MFEKYIGDEKNRFVLGNNGERTLVIFGINPSIANKEKSDPTISTILNRLETWGYDSFVMLNIYPERATQLKNLPQEIDENLHKKNIEEIKKVISTAYGVLIAWGNQIKHRDYFYKICLKEIEKAIDESCIKTYCLGTSKSGHPYHPIARVKKPEKLIDFEFKNYCENLKWKKRYNGIF